MTGIYGGDGERLSLLATFPGLRGLELEHGSVLRGLEVQPPATSRHPAFVSLRGGMHELVQALARSLERTEIRAGSNVTTIRKQPGRFVVETASTIESDAVVLAVPAFVVAELLEGVDRELADLHAEIPYASSAIVTLAYRREELPHPLDGYGYVVPSTEGSDVLACTWSSSKWEERAPDGFALLRVYAGRFGRRDVTQASDAELVALARAEVRLLGVDAPQHRSWIHRWPRGMPQYVLGHLERVEQIESALEVHPGLAVAGAAYRGVGIPDCIRSGEEAAESVARSLAAVPR
jgi:protoporphyrinogen/coproporphyrinogen III oxidase